GYAPAPTKPSYGGYGTPPPKPEPSPVAPNKKIFDQFYDNLKLCAAENVLEQCIISSQSRRDCLSEQRINTCTTQFIQGLCKNIATTSTGCYDNGYFKATTDTCVDAALADSLLVYNKLLREVNTALAVTPQFDEWTFTTLKLALASTRNHADCVIKSFFNYLNGCARSRVLPVKDLKCLDKALNNGKCEWAKEVADGWNLPSFLKKYGSLVFHQALGYMKQRWGTTQDAALATVIQDLVAAVTDETTQSIEFIDTDYDFTHRRTSINVCTLTAPWHVLTKDGADALSVQFHLPPAVAATATTSSYGPMEWPNEDTTEWSGADSIYARCDAYFTKTKKEYEATSGLTWECLPFGSDGGTYLAVRLAADTLDAECLTAKDLGFGQCTLFKDADTCTKATPQANENDMHVFKCGDALQPVLGESGYDVTSYFCGWARQHLGNARDKCFSSNGHMISFLDTGGAPQPIRLENIVDAHGNNIPFCKKVSWAEPQSCNSHLTQWTQSVSCCKSYQTVLRELQTAWDTRVGYDNNGGSMYGRRGSVAGRYDGNQEGYKRYLDTQADQTTLTTQEGTATNSLSPDRPTSVPKTFDTKSCPYEKILTSRADDWELGAFHGALYSMDDASGAATSSPSTATLDVPDIDKRLDLFMSSWFTKCQRAADDGGRVTRWCQRVGLWWSDQCAHLSSATPKHDIETWCQDPSHAVNLVSAYANQPLTRRDPVDTAFDENPNGGFRASFLDGSMAYKRLCKTLQRSWDLDTIVPIVSTKCFPQSCVLAKLAQCVDIPESNTGYDYVAQPAAGYGGYRPSGYQRSLLAMTASVHIAVVPLLGFVAGVVVVGIAHATLTSLVEQRVEIFTCKGSCIYEKDALRYGRVPADGIEYSSFHVDQGVNQVQLTFSRSDLNGRTVAPRIYGRYGAFPNLTTYDWNFNGTVDSFWLEYVIPNVQFGTYFVAVVGGNDIGTVNNFGIGNSTAVWYYLDIVFTACLDRFKTGYNCDLYVTPTMQFPVVSYPIITKAKATATTSGPTTGCLDYYSSLQFYSIAISSPQLNLALTLTFPPTFPSNNDYYWAVYANQANPLDALTNPLVQGDGYLSDGSASFALAYPSTGIYWVLIYLDSPPSTSKCSQSTGTAFSLAWTMASCGAATLSPRQAIDLCPATTWLRMNEIRLDPQRNQSAADAWFYADSTVVQDASTPPFSLAYTMHLREEYAGVSVVPYLVTTAPLDDVTLASIRIIVRVNGLPTPTLVDYTFDGVNASALPEKANTVFMKYNADNMRTNFQTTVAGPLYVVAFPRLRYPLVGDWNIALKSTQTTSWEHLLVLRTTACPDNMCGPHGSCVVKETFQGLTVGTCVCIYGYSGTYCDTIYLPHYQAQSWFLILSNLAILPAAVLSFQHELYVESFLFLSLGILSSLYHACDLSWYCVIEYRYLQKLDFIFSFNSILLCLFHLAGIRPKRKAIMQLIGFTLLTVLISINPTTMVNWVIIGCIGGGQLAIAWTTYIVFARVIFGKSTKVRKIMYSFFFLSNNFHLPRVALGAFSWLCGLLCWFLNKGPSYWLEHSLWHIFAMSSAGALISCRRNVWYKIVDDDGLDVLPRVMSPVSKRPFFGNPPEFTPTTIVVMPLAETPSHGRVNIQLEKECESPPP
ncbi:hypothetical protein As57867_002681, partial [Aphanomyces stellatus]